MASKITTLRHIHRFNHEFSEYLKALGAIRNDPDADYAWSLETPLGSLQVTIAETDVAVFAKFEDISRARVEMKAVNPWKGKWNWTQYSFDTFESFYARLTSAFDALMATEDVFDMFS